MLAVPERENDRQIGFGTRVGVIRLEREARRFADETQIFGGECSYRHRDPALPPDLTP
jgi:hypothetical protein